MNYFLTVILPVIIAILVGFVLERVMTVIVSRSGKKRGMRPSHIHLFGLILRWILGIVVVVVIAGIFGVSLANLWVAITGIVAMALIGFFASWSILGNILSTLIVLIWRPFQVGDTVTILPEELSGEAVDLNLIFTKLKTPEGDMINVPNTTFVTKLVKVSTGKR